MAGVLPLLSRRAGGGALVGALAPGLVGGRAALGRAYAGGADAAPGPPPTMDRLQKKTEGQVMDLIEKARAQKLQAAAAAAGEEEEDDGFINKITGEEGGPKGLEPTRFGDWEQKGRCSDF